MADEKVEIKTKRNYAVSHMLEFNEKIAQIISTEGEITHERAAGFIEACLVNCISMLLTVASCKHTIPESQVKELLSGLHYAHGMLDAYAKDTVNAIMTGQVVRKTEGGIIH